VLTAGACRTLSPLDACHFQSDADAPDETKGEEFTLLALAFTSLPAFSLLRSHAER
jgi:hypothetical protein